MQILEYIIFNWGEKPHLLMLKKTVFYFWKKESSVDEMGVFLFCLVVFCLFICGVFVLVGWDFLFICLWVFGFVFFLS